MTRYYMIEWYPKKNCIARINKITINEPTGRTDIDAKTAVDLFVHSFGNLKKNNIVCIKEFDENGQIGEDIKPTEGENAIIPTGK